MPNHTRSPASRTSVWSVVVVFLLASCGRLVPAGPPSPQVTDEPDRIAFVGVSVIPMDVDTVLPRHTVIVRDGRIERVGPTSSTPVPLGSKLIPGTGKYLLPGFVEMHAHIPPPTEGVDEVENVLFLYLAAGVTTIRGMLGDPGHLDLRDRAAGGDLLSPRIYTSGPSLNGQSAPDPATARRIVEAQGAAGYDFLKLHPGLSREVFDTIVAVATPRGIPFAGHVSVDVGLVRTLEAGQSTIDHLDGYVDFLAMGDEADGTLPGFFGFNLVDRIAEDRFEVIVERTRAAGVANVPTQTLAVNFAGSEEPEALAARAEMRYMPRRTVAQWTSTVQGFRAADHFTEDRGERFIAARNRLIRELHEAGAAILLGSDAPQVFNVPGFSALREMVLLVEAGLSPFDALVAGTRGPAAHLDALDDWGTIRPGRSADLILLDDNPLVDIRNVEGRSGVMVRGLWLTEPEIEERLDRIARLRAR
jgi:hypothetical protein